MPREAARVRLIRANGRLPESVGDFVAAEEPIEVRIGGKPVAVIMRTPGDDFALTAGFLYTEGVVRSFDDIDVMSYCPSAVAAKNIVDVRCSRKVSIARLKRNLYAASSCGICGKASLDLVAARVHPVRSRMRVDAETLYGLPDLVRSRQPIFARTGGLHAAGIFDGAGQLMFLKEDIGRHNALDKAIGTALIAGRLPLDSCILVVSGRESFEIMQKAAAAGIPIVCGLSAPSSLAVDFAKRFRMTLVGLLRGRSMNVYAGAWRVRF